MDTVRIGAAPLAIEDVVAVARGAPVELTPQALARIRAGRAVVDAALSSGDAVYGLTTGVGHMKDVRVPDDALRDMQTTLLVTHAAGLEPLAPTELVRAAMAARLIGMAGGGSGATEAVARTLVAMLNAGVHPIVPAEGSVGAGDLGQMATIGLVAIGRGTAELGGRTMAGADALAAARIEPLVVQPKDGLALMSANGISIGHGALAVARAEELAAVADVAAALSMEALGGNPSVILPAVGRAKPYPGQIASADAMRRALDGSWLLGDGAPRSVQDPLAFRVAPQVHGALRETISWTRRAVETELNSMSDNPLVDVETGAMVHNGNFHPMVLAVASDAQRVAVAHAGVLSERRMSHLWDAFFARMADFAGGPPPADAVPELFGLSLRYPAAALSAELLTLAAPASLGVPPLDIGVEDHATGAPLSVRRSAEALEVLAGILSVELLLARDIRLTSPAPRPSGRGTAAAVAALERTLAGSTDDRSPATIHRRVREEVLPAVASEARSGLAGQDDGGASAAASTGSRPPK
jgi:histidine ammonia-lyase